MLIIIIGFLVYNHEYFYYKQDYIHHMSQQNKNLKFEIQYIYCIVVQQYSIDGNSINKLKFDCIFSIITYFSQVDDRI